MPESRARALAPLAWLRPASPLGRVRLGLLLSLVAFAGAAWWLTIHHAVSMGMPMGIAVRGSMAAEGMPGMAAGGWSVGGALVFAVVWMVMMAAMMLPAVAPMVLIFASAQARREKRSAVVTWIFVCGYLVIWAAVGLLVYAVVQAGSDVATSLAPVERQRWAPLALGATLLVAGLYQFTPVKRACLTHCRSPLAFFAQHWRAGRTGALVMGFMHGGYCLGCCWALFALMVAAGVMSLAWMLLLALIVFAEKVLPQGRLVAVATGIALTVLGILVATGMISMPWLA